MWKIADKMNKNTTETPIPISENEFIKAYSEEDYQSNNSGFSRVKSCISSELCFKGEISGNDDLTVNGRVEGAIFLKNNAVVVGRTAYIKGNIFAKNITIEGAIEGDVVGFEQVALKKSAEVRGNISAPNVTIESGAKVKGSIDMEVGKPVTLSPEEEQEALELRFMENLKLNTPSFFSTETAPKSLKEIMEVETAQTNPFLVEYGKPTIDI